MDVLLLNANYFPIINFSPLYLLYELCYANLWNLLYMRLHLHVYIYILFFIYTQFCSRDMFLCQSVAFIFCKPVMH